MTALLILFISVIGLMVLYVVLYVIVNERDNKKSVHCPPLQRQFKKPWNDKGIEKNPFPSIFKPITIPAPKKDEEVIEDIRIKKDRRSSKCERYKINQKRKRRRLNTIARRSRRINRLKTA